MKWFQNIYKYIYLSTVETKTEIVKYVFKIETRTEIVK